MGRVSRYKKIRSVDPFSKQRGGNINYNTIGVWGLGVASVKTKKRSRTAQKLYEAKLSKRNVRTDTSNKTGKGQKVDQSIKLSRHQSDGSILHDEFDLTNLTGTVTKQTSPLEEFLLHSDAAAAAAEQGKANQKEKSILKQQLGTSQVDEGTAGTDINTTTIFARALQQEDDKMMKKLQQQVQQQQKTVTATTKLVEGNTLADKGEGSEGVNGMIHRKDGETLKEYRKRRQHEMQLLTSTSKVQMKRNLEKVARKKEFLTNKKKKKKNNNKFITNKDDDDDDNDYDNNESEDDDVVTVRKSGPAYEQQVERPPVFRQLPRGAVEKTNNNTSSLVKTSTTKLSSSNQTKQKTTSKNSTTSSEEMELLRQKVQAQYAMIRSQRRHAYTSSRNQSKSGRTSNSAADTLSSSGRIHYPGYLE